MKTHQLIYGMHSVKAILNSKPENIIDKIVDGKMSKFYEEVCLLNQKFIKNDKISIQQHINELAKKLDRTLTVARFVRFKIGT